MILPLKSSCGLSSRFFSRIRIGTSRTPDDGCWDEDNEGVLAFVLPPSDLGSFDGTFEFSVSTEFLPLPRAASGLRMGAEFEEVLEVPERDWPRVRLSDRPTAAGPMAGSNSPSKSWLRLEWERWLPPPWIWSKDGYPSNEIIDPKSCLLFGPWLLLRRLESRILSSAPDSKSAAAADEEEEDGDDERPAISSSFLIIMTAPSVFFFMTLSSAWSACSSKRRW